MTMKQDALSYCETHDVSFPEGFYCPIAEVTGEECEFAAGVTLCLECGQERPDDDRVAAEPEKVTP